MKNPITAFIDRKLQKFDPLWQAENGKGGLRSRYHDKTGIAKYREWRGVHDTMVDYLAWLNNLKSMGLMVASAPLPVLKGISMKIREGTLLALMGPSGGGKSTLMNILGFLDTSSGGQYLLDGRDVTTLSANARADLRNARIGFVFQNFNLLARTSALKNVLMPLEYAKRRQSAREERAWAENLLRRVGLGDRMSHKPAQLSGGEKQRVAVARALVNRPDVVLADEPSGRLDTQNKTELHNLFFDLRREFGHTFLIVTHDETLARLSDRMIELCDGRIVAQTSNTEAR